MDNENMNDTLATVISLITAGEHHTKTPKDPKKHFQESKSFPPKSAKEEQEAKRQEVTSNTEKKEIAIHTVISDDNITHELLCNYNMSLDDTRRICGGQLLSLIQYISDVYKNETDKCKGLTKEEVFASVMTELEDIAIDLAEQHGIIDPGYFGDDNEEQQ